jgi:hypothetical protein
MGAVGESDRAAIPSGSAIASGFYRGWRLRLTPGCRSCDPWGIGRINGAKSDFIRAEGPQAADHTPANLPVLSPKRLIAGAPIASSMFR